MIKKNDLREISSATSSSSLPISTSSLLAKKQIKSPKTLSNKIEEHSDEDEHDYINEDDSEDEDNKSQKITLRKPLSKNNFASEFKFRYFFCNKKKYFKN